MSDDDWSSIRKQVSVSEDQLNELFEKNDKMRPVYDAAMALAEAGIDKMCFVFADDSDKYDNLRLELIAACRRAKEGRDG